MASIKDMRTGIKSVQATQKITKALQMVAAAKLRLHTGNRPKRAALRHCAWRR